MILGIAISFYEQLAKLSPDDMKVINNMKLLGGSSDSKKTAASGGFSLKFDGQKVKISQLTFENNTDFAFLKNHYFCLNKLEIAIILIY